MEICYWSNSIKKCNLPWSSHRNSYDSCTCPN